MSEIIRNRTIRPSSRKATSVNYRVHRAGIGNGDTLIVNITHESQSFRKTYIFSGGELLKKKKPWL